MIRPSSFVALVFGGLVVAGSVALADWTFYRGPLENGISTEKLGPLPMGGLRELWLPSALRCAGQSLVCAVAAWVPAARLRN